MNEIEIKEILESLENKERKPRPKTNVGTEADKIPIIIDIGYYTGLEYWGKQTETAEETLQFYINTATIHIDRLSNSEFGTIFDR